MQEQLIFEIEITIGKMYLLDGIKYKCLAFKNGLGWFQEINGAGLRYREYYNNSPRVIDWGKRLIHDRISELKPIK